MKVFRQRWGGKTLNSGFTMIEMIMVMILLGILSVTAISLFATRDAYSARVVADQILSQARLAEQIALGRRAASTTTLTLSLSGSDFSGVVAQGGYVSQRDVDASGVSINWSQSATTSCAGSALPATITFNQDGDVINPATSGTTNTLICVSGDTVYPICVTTLGYAYEGFCES
ncbi:prepilin-type N-terminal cleavage/methylation domain-containing protein [Hahella sp. HN01]|uniref:pilus assembly FimT family protein n=1 Tax=Hahella sp. HN01 TaxID=2847262 RepID=UPI001C1F1861|nr:prepilin-type N-terminal cleavage/methylation domain-containing protein [Hahella sp. HN01]